MAALLAVMALLSLGAGTDTLFVEESTFGSFQNATRLCVTPQGSIYVVDGERNTVLLFKNPAAEPIVVGGYGWSSTSFDQPTSISTDGINIYVADFGNHRLQRFDRNLNFISTFATRDTSVEAARFGYPAGAIVSRFGDLFILDSENLRVAKFAPQLRFERSFGSIETEKGRIRRPRKLLSAPDDHIIVMEPDRLIEYDYFGNYVRTIGEGVFLSARGFDVSARGIVVATDSSLFWFSLRGESVRITPVATILSSKPLAPLADVAVTQNRLYILGRDRVSVFRIVDD